MVEALVARFTTLLRWSEKYTKTDMVYLVSNSWWFILGTGAVWTIGLFSTLAFANLISKETYGTYQYVLSIADLFGIFVLGGMDTAVSRASARGKDGSLFAAIREKIRWGFIGATGCVLLGVYYLIQENAVLGYSFIIAGIAIPFWETPGIFVPYLSAKKRFDLTSFYEVGTQLFATVTVILALYFSKDVIVILTTYLISWSAGRTFFFWMAIRQEPPNTIPDPEVIPYGKHLTAMSGVSNLSTQMDTVLLWHFLGPATIAVYIFSQAIPQRIAGVIKIVNRIAFPKMATMDHAVLKRTLFPKIFGLAAIGALGAGTYVLAAPLLFQVFFPQYLDSVPYTQLLAVLIVLQPFSLLSTSLTALAKKKALYVYNFGIPVARILLFLVLIPPFHIYGAVIALLLTKVIDALLLTVLFLRSE